MIIGFRRTVERVAEEFTRRTRKRIRINRGAFDDPGIAEARFPTGFTPVDQRHGASLGLDIQGGAKADYAGAQNDHIGLHAYSHFTGRV